MSVWTFSWWFPNKPPRTWNDRARTVPGTLWPGHMVPAGLLMVQERPRSRKVLYSVCPLCRVVTRPQQDGWAFLRPGNRGQDTNVEVPGLYESPGLEEPLLCPAGWSPSQGQSRPKDVACLCTDGRPVHGHVCRQTTSTGPWALKGHFCAHCHCLSPCGRQAGGLPRATVPLLGCVLF